MENLTYDLGSPCHVNVHETKEVIQRFRDLFNIGPMLEWDVTQVRLDFCKQLQAAGWDDEHINNFQTWAASTSIWENEIPKNIREVGTMPRFKKLKSRSSSY